MYKEVCTCMCGMQRRTKIFTTVSQFCFETKKKKSMIIFLVFLIFSSFKNTDFHFVMKKKRYIFSSLPPSDLDL